MRVATRMGWVALSTLAILGSEPTRAQVAATPPQLSTQSLADRIDALPGRPVAVGALVGMALTRNIELGLARISRDLAEADVDVEGGLFDPTLSFSGGLLSDPLTDGLRAQQYSAGISKVFGLGTRIGLDLVKTRDDINVTPIGSQITHGTDLRLRFSQPLLEGFNVRDVDLRVAGVARVAARYRLDRAIELVVADIESQYWALAEAEAVEAVLQKSLEDAEFLAFRNEELFERGLLTEVDVITAQSGAALRRANLVDAQRVRRDASDALLFLVHGVEAAAELAVDSLPVKTEPMVLSESELPSEDEAVISALAERRDLAATREDLRGAEVLLDDTRSGVRPSLSLDGLLSSTGSDPAFGGAFDDLASDVSWSLGVTLSAPIGNRTDRGLNQAASWTRGLRLLVVSDTENRVREDVRRALRGVRSGRERVSYATQAADLSLTQLNGERARLELGLGDSFRLLETEENAVQAELVSVRSRFDLARALTALRLAIGTVADRYRGSP